MSGLSGTLKFLMVVGRLKHLKRTGWVKREVSAPEDVAGHMYRMAIMSLLLPQDNADIDRNKVIKMSLVHDLAEAIAGDITPMCGVSSEEKYLREKNGLVEMVSTIDKENAEEIQTLWQEYEDQSSAESRLVKDFDKFDMILQAHEYETAEGRPGRLQEFFNSTSGKFHTPLVQGWVKCLDGLREQAMGSKEDPAA